MIKVVKVVEFQLKEKNFKESEHPLFLHFPGLIFKIFFVEVEAF